MKLQFSTPHSQELLLEATELVIAGWTGRDAKAIEHHIEELAAIGVPRPSRVPLYYRVSLQNLTQSASIEVLGSDTSGEAEPVLFKAQGQWWITVGSDHTDRKAENASVAWSKQLCQKVLATQAWPLHEVEGHLDQLGLASGIPGENGTWISYQDGSLKSIRPLLELVKGYRAFDQIADGFVMSCGTIPAIGGIRAAAAFKMSLSDPVLGRRIESMYAIQALPVVA